jgi:hypothetical protein
MAKIVDYHKKNSMLNEEASNNESAFGESRKKTFDDGIGEPSDKGPNDIGKQFEWPDEMKKHFELQDNINSFMNDRANSGLEEDI